MAAVEQNVTPDSIFQVAQGFMASKHLFTAGELGLFAALGDGTVSLDELAAQIEAPRRTVRIVVDAMVALGFVQREPAGYRNAPVAAAFLSGRSPFDLGALLRFWNRISYPAWTNLEEAVRHDRPVSLEFDSELQTIFSEGVEAFTRGTAAALAEGYDFGRHERVLDVGGGTGSFLVQILARHEDVSGTLFELPEVAEVARRRLGSVPVADRIMVVEGSALDGPIPPGHDCLLLANVVHVLSPEQNATVFRNARHAVDDGAILLLADFWTDPTHTEPLPAALLAGEFLALVGGDVYSVEEVGEWLSAAGWRFAETRPLAGPSSLIVAKAV